MIFLYVTTPRGFPLNDPIARYYEPSVPADRRTTVLTCINRKALN